MLEEQFKMTPIGTLVCAAMEDSRSAACLIDAYLVDYVYMSHPCHNKSEHQVYFTLITHQIVPSVYRTVGLPAPIL